MAQQPPLASLTDGSLAGLVGYRLTGVLLAVPAMMPLAYLIVRHRLLRKRLITTDGNKSRDIHNRGWRNGQPSPPEVPSGA